MASKGPFLDTLAGTPRSSPPIWLMRQAGRYLPEYREVRAQVGGFLDLCYTPELAARVTLQPIERFGLDAAIVFSDILVVADALGVNVAFEEDRGPVLTPVCRRSDVDRLDVTRAVPRLAPVLETVRRVRAVLAPDVALIGFAGAPWTVAAYMVEGGASRDFVAVKRWAYAEPEGFAALIDRIVAVSVDYLVGQVEAGADALQVFDSWAGVLAPEAFERWCIAPTRRLVAAVRARVGPVPVIGFPRLAGAGVVAYAATTGITAVGLDTTVPLAWARRALPENVILQGNLDPVALLAGGHALADATRAILDVMAGRPFIFNLGHGVLPETPPEHVADLVRLVRGGRLARGDWP
ncbi:MAG: uroporphyrinogen decarboxylase [Alphaproteobacteria bacterium]